VGRKTLTHSISHSHLFQDCLGKLAPEKLKQSGF